MAVMSPLYKCEKKSISPLPEPPSPPPSPEPGWPPNWPPVDTENRLPGDPTVDMVELRSLWKKRCEEGITFNNLFRIVSYSRVACQTQRRHFHTPSSGSIVLTDKQLETQGPKVYCTICLFMSPAFLHNSKFYVELSTLSTFWDGWIYAFLCLLAENDTWIK